MTLKIASFRDDWRKALRRSYALRITRFQYRDLRSLSDGDFVLPEGITGIVGANGVGKSTLLRALGEVLGLPSSNLIASKSVLTAEITSSGRQSTVSISPSQQGQRTRSGQTFEGSVKWLDPSDRAVRLFHLINEDANFGEVIEPLEPKVLESEELNVVSYLVGKSYSRVEIFEVSDYDDEETFPYFKVQSSGVEYGSEQMGRGELSLMLCYWTLADLPHNSVLILEEPETHVSPSAQETLMNLIARDCAKKGLSVIIATHSPTIIKNLPQENLLMVVRANGPSTVTPSTSKAAISTLLGAGLDFSGLLLVEDVAARDFVLVLLQHFDRELANQLEVVVAGSASSVQEILSLMPKTGKWFTLVGVYDGNERGKKTKPANWPHVYLPGSETPEVTLIHWIQNDKNALPELAASLNKTVPEIQLALNSAAGKDPHDYLSIVALSIGCNLVDLRRAAVRLWLQAPCNLPAAQDFIDNLRQATEVR